MKVETKRWGKILVMVSMGLMVASSTFARGGNGKGKGQRKDQVGCQQCAKGNGACRQCTKSNGACRQYRKGKKGGKPQWAEEHRAFIKKQHEKVAKFFEGQREKMKAHREALRNEKDPQKVLAMIKKFHSNTTKTMKSFFQRMKTEHDKFMESMFEKYKVAEEDQKKIKARFANRAKKMKKMAEERQEQFKKAIKRLEAKEDLTKKDIMEAMRSLRKGHGRGKGKGWHGKGQKGEHAKGHQHKHAKRGVDNDGDEI